MGNATKYTKYVTKMLNCYSNQTNGQHDSNHGEPFLSLGGTYTHDETCLDDLFLSSRKSSELEHSTLLSLEGFSLSGMKTNNNNNMSDSLLGGAANYYGNPSLSEETNGWIHHTTNSNGKEDRTKVDKVLKILGILFCFILSCLTVEEVGEEVVHTFHPHTQDVPPSPFPTDSPYTSRTQLVTDCCLKLSASVGQSDIQLFDPNLPQAQAIQFFLTGSGRNVTVPSNCQWDTDFGSLYALMVLRASLDIPTSSWKQSNNNHQINHIRDVCNWHRITCDPSKQQIRKLHLSHLENNSTRRIIPHELAGLKSLDRIELYSNPDLIGTIPSTIGELSNLEYLYIHHTSITGTIPQSLSSLSKLRDLFLESTKLSGSMPKGLCKLKVNGKLNSLHADCAGSKPKVQCPTPLCCDHCYRS